MVVDITLFGTTPLMDTPESSCLKKSAEEAVKEEKVKLRY